AIAANWSWGWGACRLVHGFDLQWVDVSGPRLGLACEHHYSGLPSTRNSGASIRLRDGRIVSFDQGSSSRNRWPAHIMDAAALDAIDEAVDHPLAARLVEVDRQLVAVDLGDVAIAELLVKDALALLERRGLTSRGGDQLTLDH